MNVEPLRYVLAIALGAIVGLLAFGLAPSYNLIWGIGLGLLVAALTLALESFLLRAEDRDPTIRPPNVPYKKNGSRNSL